MITTFILSLVAHSFSQQISSPLPFHTLFFPVPSYSSSILLFDCTSVLLTFFSFCFSPFLLPRPWAFESSIATIMRRDEQTVVVEKFVVYVLTVALISQRDRAVDVTGPCTRRLFHVHVRRRKRDGCDWAATGVLGEQRGLMGCQRLLFTIVFSTPSPFSEDLLNFLHHGDPIASSCSTENVHTEISPSRVPMD